MTNITTANANSKNEFIEYILSSNLVSGAIKKSSLKGNCLWCIIEQPLTKSQNKQYEIGLFLIRKHGPTSWSCQFFSELDSPQYYTCPIRMIDFVEKKSELDKNDLTLAIDVKKHYEWREKVKSFHSTNVSNIKKKKTFKVGDAVSLNGVVYTLDEKLAAKSGWNVISSSGIRRRMNIRQLHKANIVSSKC